MDVPEGIGFGFGHGITPEDLVNHLFLPKRLPNEEEGNIGDIEGAILGYLEKISGPILRGNALLTTKTTVENWKRVQCNCGDTLSSTLEGLSRKESACLYVRKQNCTIHFTKVDDEHMRIVTFRSSLPNENITSTCGSLLVTYPETVDVVPISAFLLSPCFAKQLEGLVVNMCEIAMPTIRKGGEMHVETREPSYPYVISEFLVGLLCPANPAEFGKVDRKTIEFQKKVRDQINYKSCLYPFRRSGLWMAAKVILQLSLQEEMGSPQEAKVMYKVILLKMLNSLAKLYSNWAEASADVTAQILTKLARRAKKLTEMIIMENGGLEVLKKEAIEMTWKTIDVIHADLSKKWEITTSPDKGDPLPVTPVCRTKENWEEDCIHDMKSLTSYLNSERIPVSAMEALDNLNMIDHVIQPEEVNLDSLLQRYTSSLSSAHQDVHLNEQSIWIHQTEWFARHQLNSSHPCDKVSNLMMAYFRTVSHLYAVIYADPVYYSKMTITFLKFIAVLDEIAVARHSLLGQYETGIKPEMFHPLLISDKWEMELVGSLQNYFEGRNSRATHGVWVKNNRANSGDFGVRFAESNEEMRGLKREILAQMEKDIASKKAEIRRVEEECNKLRSEANLLSHSYTWNRYHEENRHDNDCQLCSVKSNLERKRNSVERYQRPLPPEEHLRDAVVFELIIPEEIAVLRDGVIVFLQEILGYVDACLHPKIEPKQIQVKWMEFRELNQFRKTSYQRICHMASMTRDTLSTHLNSGNPDVLLASESSFILENGLSCHFNRTPATLNTPQSPFTFKVERAEEKEAVTYKSLQFALNKERPSENEALAKQYQCHQNLTLREFKAFGALRCGHHVQLRNLYAELASKTLSLDKEPVLQLILQTVWELGPGQREIHCDFESEESTQFALAFLELLDTCGRENGTNWSNPLVLVSLSVITIRILEMSSSPEVKQAAGQILQSYRQIAERWCQTLEEILVRTADASDAEELMTYLLKAALTTLFTFNVTTSKNLSFVVTSALDIKHWLLALSRLHYLVVRENILKQNPPSHFISDLLRHARHAIPLNVQPYLHDALAPLNSALHQFAASKWFDAGNIPPNAIPTFVHSGYQCPVKKHAYQAQYKIIPSSSCHQVCVDILRGTFFVDGYPPSMLPESIIRHPLYQSFFRSSQFRVQRVGRTFKTADPYRNLHFEFTEGDNSILVIRQLQDGDYWYELVPPHLLKVNVAHDLVLGRNFTHWFDSSTKSVHFRRPSASDTEENIENDTDYLLAPLEATSNDLLPNTWHLQKYDGTENASNCYLISIKSEGFLQIVQNLQKLESDNFIHVQNKDGNISARLWRHNLSFTLQSNGLLGCDNYPGFYLPLSQGGGQNLGALVGLRSGIVLEKETTAEVSGKKKIFLVQHGPLQITSEEGPWSHQHVVVTGLKNPTYFAFEVDQTLHRLCPGKSKSAWLYLAALHAATSSPWPDPFTQLTGAEMALWILQSAYVWSCSPYSKECTETLQQIAAMSPVYQYYPDHLKVMQTVHWPKGLEKNSYAAYDGYAIIVEKLLRDSRRLSGLFPEKVSNISEGNTMELCYRSYYRYINIYNTAAQLSFEFIKNISVTMDCTHELGSYKGHIDRKALTTLAKYRQLRSPCPKSETVSSLIMTSTPLPPETADELTKEGVPTWLQTKFRDNWLQLYTLTLNQGPQGIEHELTFILGAMLYSRKGSLGQLLNLHNVTVGPHSGSGVAFPPPPKSLVLEGYNPLDNEYRTGDIESAVELDASSPPSESCYSTYLKYLTGKAKHERDLEQQVRAACGVIREYWPTQEISTDQFHRATGDHDKLSTSRPFKRINGHFRVWYNNRNLKLFVENVDELLTVQGGGTAALPETGPVPSLQFQMVLDIADRWSRNESCFGSLIDPNSKTYQIMASGQLDRGGASPSPLFTQREECIRLGELFSARIRDLVIGDSPCNEAMNKAGLHDRVAPVVLLREKFGGRGSLSEGNSNVRALAVVWAQMRRLNRIIMYTNDQEKYSVELKREEDNRECENWNPLENPEWLLLELELDLTIRPIQVEVARRMMEMPNGKSGTLQLNMGEGKTSVIIPMIVATLSSRKDVLCRVTVLNSIFATNFNLLGGTIGGLVNKRLYTVPCSRELNVAKYLGGIQHSYEECLQLGGAVMTLPEYRLSFRLQMYNNFLQSGKETVGQQVHRTETWLRQRARDLVDESDEIFSVKYQLIYTTGKQLQIDGGSLRWSVCQKLLEFLPEVASHLFSTYGSRVVEFNPVEAGGNPEKFTHFRILGEEVKQDLNELMVNGILEGKVNLIGRVLRNEERELMKAFLIDDAISEEAHLQFLQMSGLSEEKRQALLIVSGYLRRGILFTALKKRWRVQYGVKKASIHSTSKLMAVPFRAKDVAAERTEFGHPDVAIVLTQLSYFYSGLSDDQLLESFHFLKTAITSPETVYNSWIRSIPPGNIKSDTVRTYQGINLQDYEQRKLYLFPILRKHRAVVNFWLENAVYPKESKQFPGKLVTNAGDLCYERCTHPTTGFSGTNDTSLLLPAQITQQDLEELEETNKKMEETLQRLENGWRRSLEMGVECRTVLEFMIEDNLRVLIDAGALMLQLGNEDIAQLWLEMDQSLQGVVYFDEGGDMVVKIRRFNGYGKRRKTDKDTPLMLSPFKDSLENCAVYLDDQHTRGTDVKLPTHFRACVTVGSGMRRDKLIQACMRMRKLGKGQSVHFYLSHEVHNKMVEEGQQRQITVEDIILWTKENSAKFEKDGLVYWATNAKTYAKNLGADDLYEASGKTVGDAIRLGKRCEDPDAQQLDVMYGTYHHQSLVVNVVPGWFTAIPNKLTIEGELEELPPKTAGMIESIGAAVHDKCGEHIPKAFIFHNMLDEEQEKELEPEQEVELEKYRPQQENPLKPALHPNVEKCVTREDTVSVMAGISRLPDLFRDTSFKDKLQEAGWSEESFATEDFINVVEKSSHSEKGNILDLFLKNIRFMVSFKGTDTKIRVLLVSQFEVDHLITALREKRCSPGTRLHMFSGRWMEGQPTFVNNPRLQVPNQERVLSQEVLAPLFVAAGNLYFGDWEEQQAFARFLGLRLRPWTAEEEAAFAGKQISSSGFVLPSAPQLREGCNFQEDPVEMVLDILKKVRNDVLRETDHVVAILDTCAYLPGNNEILKGTTDLTEEME